MNSSTLAARALLFMAWEVAAVQQEQASPAAHEASHVAGAVSRKAMRAVSGLQFF